jgi:16S rRNA (adenine1518-N6/adenine1519-N6)-dimethyltransferase
MIHKAKKSLGLKKISGKIFSPETSYFKARKSLGQNFLKSAVALRAMCEAGELVDDDVILEIGPGKGALTEKLLEKASKVYAVEKDIDLVNILEDKFKKELGEQKLVIINEDILSFDPRKYNLHEGKYKLIANIPYNITGAIIKKFLSETEQPSNMALLVQKEVATRIVASDKKESILSLSVKAYGVPKYVMKVGKRFFSPMPKVDSGIISIKNISRKNFSSKIDEDNFFKIVKAGFAHKRKVLKKNLESVVDQSTIESIFEKLGISDKARAEDVDFEKWLEFSKILPNHVE